SWSSRLALSFPGFFLPLSSTYSQDNITTSTLLVGNSILDFWSSKYTELAEKEIPPVFLNQRDLLIVGDRF
ncbi:MAG: hypothetical protein AAF655_14050, partial [Bacteroidota bacterium]